MAKTKEKTYDIPEELMDIILESWTMGDLRDTLVKLPFRFKKAKQCAIAQTTLRDKFWREVMLLYPELKGKPLKLEGRCVRVNDV